MLMMASGFGTMDRMKRDVTITRNFLGGCPAIEIGHEDLNLSLEIKPQSTELMKHIVMGTPVHQLQRPKQLEKHPNTINTAYRASPSTYHSVCTLEKVKSALERAKNVTKDKQQLDVELHVGSPTSSSTSSSSITASNSSVKRSSMDREEEGSCGHSSGSLMAAGCPSCLMYVLIAKDNPKCPRCKANVPLPPAQLEKMKANKKSRIDLNFSLNFSKDVLD